MKTGEPLVSFILFAYNQEKYIEDAINAAFTQTYSPLEIILSDDCSQDRTFDIMLQKARQYKGPHNIVLNRNNNNLGLIGHVNLVFSEIAKGEIFIMAAGDDISLPSRTEIVVEKLKDNKITSVSSDYQNIDSENKIFFKKQYFKKGRWELKDYLKYRYLPLIGCTRAYKRVVFDYFGPFKEINNLEDATLVYRSLLLGQIYHISEVLVNYRVGIESISKSIDFSLLNNVTEQRVIDTNHIKFRGGIDENTFRLLLYLFKQSKEKTKKKQILMENNSLFYFLREILFDKEFSNRDKKIIFKAIMHKKYIK